MVLPLTMTLKVLLVFLFSGCIYIALNDNPTLDSLKKTDDRLWYVNSTNIFWKTVIHIHQLNMQQFLDNCYYVLYEDTHIFW